eukprot:11409437-Karenia_brevis.AAC.1
MASKYNEHGAHSNQESFSTPTAVEPGSAQPRDDNSISVRMWQIFTMCTTWDFCTHVMHAARLVVVIWVLWSTFCMISRIFQTAQQLAAEAAANAAKGAGYKF